MEIRVIDNNIVIETELSRNRNVSQIERKDVTADVFNRVFEYMSNQDKFRQNGFVTIDREVNGKDCSLVMMTDDFTVVENKIIDEYESKIENLKIEIGALKANMSNGDDNATDGEFTEIND